MPSGMSADFHTYDVAIAGGGASGTLTALNLLALADGPIRVGLWDDDGRFGQGVAYSTVHPEHRLNVPARSMGAWPDRPTHFLEWLRATGLEVADGDFVPRARYGAYLQELLYRAQRRPSRGALTLHAEAMNEVEPTSDGMTGRLTSGVGWRAKALVLAIGNQLPANLRVPDHGVYGSAAYHRSPWSTDALAGIPADAAVLLLGAGLTSVDVVVSLRAAGHRGPIHALSRHGLWPHLHSPFKPLNDGWKPPLGGSLQTLLRAVRHRVARARPEESWQAVVDALRPFSQPLWSSLSLADQRRFIRHLRPYWDVHRHRVAPEPGGMAAALREEGALTTHAGRLLEFRPESGEVVATFRPRGEGSPRQLRVSRVINCTGPATLSSAAPPLLDGLLQRGEAVLDPHAQGLRADLPGALLDKEGRTSNRLFTLGPLRRGELWETTAVPEIRAQAQALARALLGD